MKRRMSALLSLLLGGGLLATVPTTPAAAVAPDLDPGQIDAMQRDLRLTDAQLAVRLVTEAAAAPIESRLKSTLGNAYAGTWVSADGRDVIAGVTDPARAAAVRAAGATPKVVGRSLATLESLAATLDRRATTAGTEIHSWYVDPVSNTVTIKASSTAAATAFARTAGLPADAVSVARSEAFKPVYDIRGGDQYVINNSVLCSVGFAVAGGFVTAGHCGGVGATTAGSGVAQGTFRGSSFPGDDLAWVQTNANWVPQPWVNNYGGGVATVAGSTEAAVGASVCRSGRTTGWRCGTITGKNVTVNYSGQLVYGLVGSSACAQPGDSGGSFLSGNQAQGVTSGAGGNCTSGGTTVYQPVNEILSRYGLSLTTTGGGSSGNRLIGLANKCIDVPNSNAVDGQFLQLWTCNGTGAQNWTWPGDGTVRALGLCMDVAWGSTANGAVIQLANCSGNPAQQWVLSGAGDLVNPQANKCIDVVDWNTADGARLILFDCHGGANQKWRRG